MSPWTCCEWLTEICMVVLLAFPCTLGKAGACPYQHPTNPNPSAVKCLLFGKHHLCDTDVSFWCCYRPYQGLSRYKPEKFNRRVLSKLVFRLLERFNVDPGMGYYNIL